MSEQEPKSVNEPDPDPSPRETIASWFGSRAGGVLVPLAATLLAFLVGGLVVLAAGKDPLIAYQAIFEGTGLNWFFPWLTELERNAAARDLQQTLIVMTPLMMTAAAVAFAFRCGLFNIGGQGQYWVGLIAAIYVGTHFEGTPPLVHVVLAIVASILAGALWGGIAGILRATVGAHEVITTIMLNWIAIYGGTYLFELSGPLHGSSPSLPRSDPVLPSAELPVIWGNIQALHAGIFLAIAGLAVYAILLNRTTLGYEVRAVGYNPEAARYSGISVPKNYFLALAISGAFAGLAGSLDILGFKHAVDTSDFSTNLVGFTGIAVALLGRNRAVGIFFASLLFAALQVGTSSRQLDPATFDPDLATNLATMIQALVIFFVAAELLILYIWSARRYLRIGPARQVDQEAPL